VPDSKPVQYRLVDRSGGGRGDERSAVVRGLLDSAPRIPPKYFYDALGCALYAAITRLPEYYPTRTEETLFRQHREEIVAAVGRGRQLVDLGAGDCAKAQAWLPFLEPSRYVAVDFAAGELERALARMAPDFPGLEMVGLVADFTAGLPLEDILGDAPALFFYPGSSIGNFTPDEAVVFLRRIRQCCGANAGSSLLIGVDGKKDPAVLAAAYDDPLGVTAAFNRNILLHLNRRFGFDFDIAAFAHRASYAAPEGRVEMHLESLREQAVALGEQSRRFAAGERIHTENSFKYGPGEFEALLTRAGFGRIARWSAPGDAYFVFHAA
jgi:dimethylhistidine N-methyltransferase